MAFCIAMFAAYVALFRGVVGEKVIHLEWSESYQITMAGLAATRLFSAGGAGGILLTYWALRKAGMERRQSVCRMVAFLVVLYSVYLAALVVFGVLLQDPRAVRRGAPLRHADPGGLAAVAIVVGLLLTLVPDDIERRIERHTSGRFGKIARRLATVPATFAQGTRTAIAFVRQPRSGADGVRRRDRVLGGQHRDPLGELPRLRRLGPARRGDPGLLPRHGRQPHSRSRPAGSGPSTPG